MLTVSVGRRERGDAGGECRETRASARQRGKDEAPGTRAHPRWVSKSLRRSSAAVMATRIRARRRRTSAARCATTTPGPTPIVSGFVAAEVSLARIARRSVLTSS